MSYKSRVKVHQTSVAKPNLFICVRSWFDLINIKGIILNNYWSKSTFKPNRQKSDYLEKLDFHWIVAIVAFAPSSRSFSALEYIFHDQAFFFTLNDCEWHSQFKRGFHWASVMMSEHWHSPWRLDFWCRRLPQSFAGFVCML